ncbi:hypothetical protein M501DRAFT_996534 [Patellaria atrata CBS 101060]|uniref:Uncharacterized protein n=1 Tax=Patellaria atrata CBS 101060 TaxID=1346257 RepID=A0A9P4S643_9PEZI|nr:hypothetical protein M501DRAFT_996534 [Patellaria atrata CBS 101060]
MTPPMRAPTAMMDVRPPVSSQPAAAGIIPPPQQNSLMLPPLLIAQITTRLEHLSDEDKFIIHHRESAQEKKTYPQMTKLFVDKFGHFLSEDQLRRRYMKAKEKLGESPRQQQGIVSDFSRDPVFSCFSTRSESPFLRYNSTVPTADAPMITAQSQTQTDSREARPTTGGKSINSEALEAYIRAIFAEPDEEQGLTAEAGTQTEPELEVQETRAEREDSQFSERDYLQWEYFVKRQTWATEDEMEHDGGWVTVGGKHSSLQQANIAAGHEITRERNGICIGTHTRKWTYDTDNEGMANYYATDGENCIRVRVVRTLCTRTSGNPPTSKAGWLPRNVYDIRRRSTIKTTKPDDEDDLFSETEKETVTLEILDGGYLILDEANREAAKMVIDIRVRKDSKRMDDQIARSDMRKAMEKANDEREKSGGAFREEWNVVVKKNGERAREERREEVWVQAVKMKGPRNV